MFNTERFVVAFVSAYLFSLRPSPGCLSTDPPTDTTPATPRASAALCPEGARKRPPAGVAQAVVNDAGPCGGGGNGTAEPEAGAGAGAGDAQGSGQIMAPRSAHHNHFRHQHDSHHHAQHGGNNTLFAGSFSSSVFSSTGGSAGGDSVSAAQERPRRAASAPKQLVR